MSLKPSLIEAVPPETMRVARAAFPKGNLYLSIREELGTLFEDADFTSLSAPRATGFCPVAISFNHRDAISGEPLRPPNC